MILHHILFFFLSRKPRAEAFVSHAGKYFCTTNNVSGILPTIYTNKKWGAETDTLSPLVETINMQAYSCVLGVLA